MTAMKGWRKERILTALPREEGTVSVEAVILLPLLVLIVLGILEFGHLWHVRHTLTIASREGARAAVVYYVKPDKKEDEDPPPNRETWAKLTALGTADAYLSRFWPKGTWTFPGNSPELTYSDGTECDPDNPTSGKTLTGGTLTLRIQSDSSFMGLNKLITPITVEGKSTMRFE
jgi:hypothetical protein